MGLRRQLLGRAARDVQLLAGLFIVFCGAALALSGASMALDYGNAVELRGILIEKDMVRADAEEKDRATRFLARYRVALPGGETVQTEEELPRAAWEARAIGSEHAVLYLASEGRVLPTAKNERAGGAVMGGIGLALLIGGALLARAPVRRLRELLRLVGSGARASAEVLDVFQTSTAVNRVILWRLRYRYRDPGGSEHEGESELLMPAEAATWPQGSTGEILYDPAHPASSAWLGREAAPEASAWRIGAKLRTAGRWTLNLVLFFVALFVAAVVAELVPALKQADAWIEAHRTELLIAAGAAAASGLALLIGSVIVMLMEGGEPLDHTGVENQQRSMRDAQSLPYTARASSYRLFGKGAGASAHDEFKIVELKQAIATGAVLRDPLWRRRACAAAGGLLMALGVPGVMIVVAPPALKLLLAAVLLYILVKTAWAFARA